MKGNDIEPPHYNQCEVLASKIHSNFNETLSNDLIWRITEVSVSKKPITSRWRMTAKDCDSILRFLPLSSLSLFHFYSLFQSSLSLFPFIAARRIELPHYVNFPGDACIFLIPSVSLIARLLLYFLPFLFGARCADEDPRERFLYRDVVESRMKPFMAARRPVGDKGRGCLYPRER